MALFALEVDPARVRAARGAEVADVPSSLVTGLRENPPRKPQLGVIPDKESAPALFLRALIPLRLDVLALE